MFQDPSIFLLDARWFSHAPQAMRLRPQLRAKRSLFRRPPGCPLGVLSACCRSDDQRVQPGNLSDGHPYFVPVHCAHGLAQLPARSIRRRPG